MSTDSVDTLERMSSDRNLEPLSVYLSPDEKKFVKKMARQCVRSESDYVRLLISQTKELQMAKGK